MAVAEADRVGPRRVVELLQDGFGKVGSWLTRQPVDVHQSFKTLCSWKIFGVDVHLRISEKTVARHVILVAVAVDHCVNGYTNSAVGHHGDRGVDHHRLTVSLDDEGVARRISALVRSNQNAHPRGESPPIVTPFVREL